MTSKLGVVRDQSRITDRRPAGAEESSRRGAMVLWLVLVIRQEEKKTLPPRSLVRTSVRSKCRGTVGIGDKWERETQAVPSV